MKKKGLVQIITEPTRGQNTLDLIITSNPTLVINQGVFPGISDHEASYANFNMKTAKNQQNPRQIPFYKKANWESLKHHMEKAHNKVKDAVNNLDMDALWDLFQSELETGIKQHIPHKTARNKDRLPWLNNNIVRLMRKRDKLYGEIKTHQCPKQIKRFKEIKNTIQKECRRAYWQYLDGLFNPEEEGQTSGLKRLWSFIKHAKKDNTGIAKLKDGQKSHSDSKEKATILNKQFQSVFSRRNPLSLEQLAQAALPRNRQTGTDTQDLYPPMQDIKINSEGVRKLLTRLNPHKAAGPDKIQSKVLKELADPISKSLTIVFNKSMQSGCLPKIWKHAEVAPVYKKGDRTQAVNYRPISLTCIACKTLEHIVVSSIMRHAEEHSILYPLQHGFRSKHSCTAQLTGFIDDVSTTMEQGLQSDVIIMDFSKAFDKVSHNKLCHKLTPGSKISWQKGPSVWS